MTKKDLLKLLGNLNDDTRLAIHAQVVILGHLSTMKIVDLELESVCNDGKFAVLRGKWR